MGPSTLSLILALWPQWISSQNAVLFSAEHIMEAKLAGEDVTILCAEWKKWNDKTRVAPGMFKRTPVYGDLNSHDNYMGLALGSVACETPELAREIVDALSQRGWAFNDSKPDVYDIRGQLMPKDTDALKVAAGYMPTIFETVYASIDLCIGTKWNLKRARMLVYENSKMDPLHRLILSPCIRRGKKMVDYIDAGCNYHGRDGVFCQLLNKNKGAWVVDPK